MKTTRPSESRGIYMSVSLCLRRFRPDELPTSAEAAVETVSDTLLPARRRIEEESGLLVDLGEQWGVVQAALAGPDASPRALGYQAVLGGDLFGRTHTEVVVFLGADEVRQIAAAMSSAEGGGQAWVARHLDAVEDAFGADVDDDFQRWLASRVDNLTKFYVAAAAWGDVVVKVAYS